jgi:hydroxyethylthiazole kinase-like uncharacterized protein yjeF
MTELLTAAQMRAIEKAAIASGEVTGLELMERAGKGVVEAIFEEWPELRATSHRAAVLCGPGNNGGDGFVVARLLRECGWEVVVGSDTPSNAMPAAAAFHFRKWSALGETQPLEFDFNALAFDDFDVYVDALFGLGFSTRRDSAFEYALTNLSSISWRFGERGKVVAIDAPSGLCLDSGRGLAGLEASDPRADLTVTFHALKPGHLIGDGPELCGNTVVADIGLSRWKKHAGRSRPEANWGGILQKPDLGLVGPATSERMRGSFPPGHFAPLSFSKAAAHPLFQRNHKYSYGHALILSGPSGRGGAARLAARGALRIGAGVVTVGCPPDAIPENAARLDAVMLRGVADGLALEEALGDGRINALCVGPGLGVDARGREVVAVSLGVSPGGPPPPSPPHRGEGSREGEASRANGYGEALPLPAVGRGEGRGARRVVLHADALTILSHNPDLFAALYDGCVLTPHAGEFARLFPDIAEKLSEPATKGPAYSKVDATRDAAERAGCVVLYKGPDTVIADPTGRCAINSAHYDRAAPWLATAGSGDVLAGFITGLLARGFSPFDAACTGAWLHVECALSFGPGLIAEDLPEELPKVFRALGL